MELHCLPIETPNTGSSCSTDPPYDNCPPFGQREKAREKEMESRAVCPSVSRPLGPSSPRPGLVPALAEVQTVLVGGREPGPWPDRSYCSCRSGLGGRAWESELRPGLNKARGQQGVNRRAEDGVYLSQSPSPSQSEEHQSALSLYDNLTDTGITGSLQEVFDMETSLQERAYKAAVPEELLPDDAVSEDKSPWSSCEILLGRPDQDKEPELDSGSCQFVQMDHLSATHPYHTESQVLWPPVEAQQSLSPRVPPPVPLADPSASALRSILTNLQQQIIRQKEVYEEQIISLEQRNEELQVEVVRLKTNLSQQRHWYQVVQAKIMESERARAAAELRNATLQRDMEQFFDTFGELNNEAKKTEYIVKSF
ncbi:rho GTPase-activating protein 22 [Kryptolebias marmoratus]|uniref:rho GTPase-activating protein 22 n=1 Tax=Kryptolebias marmoratus TaxID=37003 RepID=UPI0007F8EC8B|nr:rho GTPase-activating protein 22 [Kryptolebias marmoratus]